MFYNNIYKLATKLLIISLVARLSLNTVYADSPPRSPTDEDVTTDTITSGSAISVTMKEDTEETQEINPINDIPLFDNTELVNCIQNETGLILTPTNLKKVTDINISSNYNIQNLNGIEYLPKLKYLYITDCPQLVVDLRLLENNTQLRELDLQNVQTIGTLDSIGKLTRLKRLIIKSSDIVGDISSLTNISSLTLLSLDSESNSLVGDIGCLESMIFCDTIHLSSKGITGSFEKLTNLNVINLTFNQTSVNGDLNDLAKIGNLEWVGLAGTELNVDVKDLQPLLNLPKLRILDVSMNHIYGNLGEVNLPTKQCTLMINSQTHSLSDIYFINNGNKKSVPNSIPVIKDLNGDWLNFDKTTPNNCGEFDTDKMIWYYPTSTSPTELKVLFVNDDWNGDCRIHYTVSLKQPYKIIKEGDITTELTTEIITESATETITESTTEFTTESITETTTEQTTESTTETTTEETTEQTTESTTEDTTAETTTENPTETITEPTKEESTTESITETTTEQVTETTTESMTEKSTEPTTEITTESTTNSETESINENTTEELTESTTEFTESTTEQTTESTTEQTTESTTENETTNNNDSNSNNTTEDSKESTTEVSTESPTEDTTKVVDEPSTEDTTEARTESTTEISIESTTEVSTESTTSSPDISTTEPDKPKKSTSSSSKRKSVYRKDTHTDIEEDVEPAFKQSIGYNYRSNNSSPVLGYIYGYPKVVTFEPKRNMTRAEYISILSRILDYDNTKIAINPYKDLYNGFWAYRDILEIERLGILYYDKEYLYPDKFISNEEIVKLMCTALDLGLFPKGTPLGDIDNIVKAKSLVCKTFNTNVASYELNVYDGKDCYTRDVLINKINSLLFYDNEPDKPDVFTDITGYENYYNDIIKSTALDIDIINPRKYS